MMANIKNRGQQVALLKTGRAKLGRQAEE